MSFKFEGKKCAPSLFLLSLVGQFTPKWLGWQECAQQTEKSHSHANSAVSCQGYVCALLVQHLCRPSVFFQHMVWHGPTSETAWMQRRKKNWLKKNDFWSWRR